MTLLERFAALPPPSQAGRYSVEAGGVAARVGRSHTGNPALLVAFPDAQGGGVAPRKLALLQYSSPSSVEVLAADGSQRRERLAILECRSTDAQLVALFFRIVEAVLLDQVRDLGTFEEALDAVVTLFRGLQRAGKRSIQGLWCELAIIAWSADPVATLSAWHSTPTALHDFAAGGYRLEVKGTVKQLREHSFSLDQLATVSPGETVVASFMMAEDDGGASAFDLADIIKERLGGSAESVRRLETVIAESLGDQWRDASEVRYSMDAARTGLAFYRSSVVPSVPQPLPTAVKDVRFVVDLSGVPMLGVDEGRQLATFFGRVLPG